MKEIWKPAYGYEKLYEVSNLGRVRSKQTHAILSSYVNENGYRIVGLNKNKNHKNWRVHRLMMLSFYGPDPEHPVVNHKDGNKLNNRLDNLEWTTSRDNNLHAVRTGLHKPCYTLKNYHVKIDDLEFDATGAIEVAKILHEHGYFTDVDIISLKTSLINCANEHRMYLGKVTIVRYDDPYDKPKKYHNCGIRKKPIRAELPSTLILKADGPADLIRKVQKFGYWKDIKQTFPNYVKKVSGIAIHDGICDGIHVWYVI